MCVRIPPCLPHNPNLRLLWPPKKKNNHTSSSLAVFMFVFCWFVACFFFFFLLWLLLFGSSKTFAEKYVFHKLKLGKKAPFLQLVRSPSTDALLSCYCVVTRVWQEKRKWAKSRKHEKRFRKLFAEWEKKMHFST